MAEISPAEWGEILARFPHAHLLQTQKWGALKGEFGWTTAYLWLESGIGRGIGAQILFRQIPFGKTVAYIPKGPVGEAVDTREWGAFVEDLDRLCHRRRAIFLIVEPDLWQEQGQEWLTGLVPEAERDSLLEPPGFQKAFQSIQPVRTILIDLQPGEAALLAGMKQKTRYNIRLAEKKGVAVRPTTDIQAFHRLLGITAARDGFAVHTLEYYQAAYRLFGETDECEILMAEHDGRPLAGLMVFRHGRRAWYLYGGSSDEDRELMPNYLLQWEAMRWAAARGCESYDLWGVPDADLAALEENFTHRSDGLWGVYRFKRGFGGILHRAAGPWYRVYQPQITQLYRWWYRRGNRGVE